VGVRLSSVETYLYACGINNCICLFRMIVAHSKENV
jgi:hypothetical protein